MAKQLRRNPNPARLHTIKLGGKVYPLMDMPHGRVQVITPNAVDARTAIPGDSFNCGVAMSWKRTQNVPIAMVGTSIAYLAKRTKDGIVLMRGQVPLATRRAIDYFDASGIMPQEGFEIHGINPTNGIDSKRAADKRYRTRFSHMKDRSKKRKRVIHLRNASRAMQAFVQDDPA